MARAGDDITSPAVATLRAGVRIVRLGVDDNGWTPVAVLGWISKELLA